MIRITSRRPEVFALDNKGKRLEEGSRVQHQKHGLGIVKLIFPCRVRVHWDTGKYRHVRDETLEIVK